jgi:hypothetical protein
MVQIQSGFHLGFSPMEYLPCNFCRSDGYWFFREIWMGSKSPSSFFLFKLLLRAFSSMHMFSSMLFLLCFYVQIPKFCISCHFYCCHQRQQSSTRIRCLFNICQQSPPLALMATLAFSIQTSALLCIRPIRLSASISSTETFRTLLLSPPLTSMSKKRHSCTELVADFTPPVI